MQEFIQNFHFLRPWVLLLTVLPFLLYRCCYNHLDIASSWEKVCDKKLLEYLLIKGSSLQRRFIFYLCTIGLISTIVAASGPSWKKQEVEGISVENPIVIVLNLSSDMMKKDVTPDRLSRAKYAVSDLLKSVKQTQSGLLVYAGEPFVISPITEDSHLINNLLQSVELNIMPENGDRLNLALRLAAESLKNGGWTRGQIVVFAADVGQDFAKALNEAEKISKEGYQVNVINVSATENEKLEQIASRGGGKYFPLGKMNVLIENLNTIHDGDLKQSQNKISQWLDAGWYFCFIPLLCCLSLFRRGIWSIIVLLVLTSTAQAGFFLNDNQEGLKAFNQEDYQTATKKFNQSEWKASSYYRLRDYEKAYRTFSETNDIESLYNQGNALAKMGKIEEAIKKYEEVLKQNPQHEDAKFNLEYLKKQKDQNQSSSSSKQNQQDENQQNQSQQQTTEAQKSDLKQNEDEQQNKNSENEQTASSEQKTEQSQSGDQDQKENQKNAQAQQQEQQIGSPREEENDKQENSGGVLQNSEEDNTYNEEAQARELQYREIPEDPGGLLRAFIAREYAKNRYAKDKQ